MTTMERCTLPTVRPLEPKPPRAKWKLFAKKSTHLRDLLKETKSKVEGSRDKLITAMLDEFGTGRVMFRNTRAALTGFPQRGALPWHRLLTARSGMARRSERWRCSMVVAS